MSSAELGGSALSLDDSWGKQFVAAHPHGRVASQLSRIVDIPKKPRRKRRSAKADAAAARAAAIVVPRRPRLGWDPAKLGYALGVLPDDAVEVVLSCLGWPELMALACTCRTLNVSTHGPTVTQWDTCDEATIASLCGVRDAAALVEVMRSKGGRVVSLTLPPVVLDEFTLPAIANVCKRVESLDFGKANYYGKGVALASLRAVASGFPNLRTLSIWGSRVAGASLADMAPGLPVDLEELRLGGIDMGLDRLTRWHAAGLRTLKVLNASDARQAGVLECIVRCAPNLESLHYANASASSTPALRALTRLRELRLKWAQANDDVLASVVEVMPDLQVLDISFCANVTVDFLECLARACPNLTLLAMNGARGVASIRPLSKLPRLRTVLAGDMWALPGTKELRAAGVDVRTQGFLLNKKRTAP